jgi:hypothetical protein
LLVVLENSAMYWHGFDASTELMGFVPDDVWGCKASV